MAATNHKRTVQFISEWNVRIWVVGLAFALCIVILVCRLAYIQLGKHAEYKKRQLQQSVRIVRVPGLRGHILDRNGVTLAESRPVLDLVIYVEDLRPLFQEAYRRLLREQGQRPLNRARRAELASKARQIVVQNITQAVGEVLGRPIPFDPQGLARHYNMWPYRPFPIVENLTKQELSRFVEAGRMLPGVDVQVRQGRFYPAGPEAAHVVGYVVRHDQIRLEDEYEFNYSLPDYFGVLGLEGGFDRVLQGRAGVNRIVINSLCYREYEVPMRQPLSGRDLVSTIDLELQRFVFNALSSVSADVKGAAVVLDPTNGEVLALASVPSFDPNSFVNGVTMEEWTNWLNNPDLRPIFNRATQGAYPPGSVFKLVTAIACLQAGVLDPQTARSFSYYSVGYYQIGNRRIDDTAPAGWYDFRTALKRSCNCYFIHYGLKAGAENLITIGRLFGFGQRFGLPLKQESAGFFPTLRMSQYRLNAGNLANLCIGQEIAVTPLQIAVMTAALVNGGKVFKPSFVLEAPTEAPVSEASLGVSEEVASSGVLWRRLPIPEAYLNLIREAMIADTEDPDATAYRAFHRYDGTPYLKHWKVGGKTGTAEIERGISRDKVAWFTSFGPAHDPRYVVVVMVEGGASGGQTCAPVARKIYQYLEQRDVARKVSSVASGR